RDSLKVWPVVVIFIGVLGGIYTGIMTAAEAAGVGAFFALMIFILMKRMSMRKFKSAIVETSRFTAMIMALIIGAMIFARFMVTTGVVQSSVQWVVGLSVNKYAILFLIIAIYLIL